MTTETPAGRKIRVELYTKGWCPFCQRAKHLLEREGIEYQEYDVEASAEVRAEMFARAEGRRTVPQIFIDGEGIGGFEELYAAAVSGELDQRLGRPGKAHDDA